jgi:hypothetical protein
VEDLKEEWLLVMKEEGVTTSEVDVLYGPLFDLALAERVILIMTEEEEILTSDVEPCIGDPFSDLTMIEEMLKEEEEVVVLTNYVELLYRPFFDLKMIGERCCDGRERRSIVVGCRPCIDTPFRSDCNWRNDVDSERRRRSSGIDVGRDLLYALLFHSVSAIMRLLTDYTSVI